MSRIFRRPMFRKGGPVNDGIMTGIVDRENHALSDPDGVGGQSYKERIMEAYDKYPAQDFDPLTQFLLEYGPSLAGTTGGGSTIGNVLLASKGPLKNLITNRGAENRAKRKIAMEGEILDIEAERARELAEIKNKQKDFFASQTPEAQFEVLTDLYSDSKIPVIKNNAYNLAEFEVSMRKNPSESYTQLGFEYGTVPGTKKKDYVPNWGSIPVGNVTYNPSTGLAYKRITRENNNASDFIPLNPSTLQPLE